MKNRFDLPQIGSLKTYGRYLLACTLYCLAATTTVVQASPNGIVAGTPGVNEAPALSSHQANHVFVDEAVQGLDLSAAAGDQRTFQLISHGRPGALYLEGAWRDAPEIAAWLQQSQRLAGQNQLNIYGCEFAKGEKGRAAVKYLEAALGVSIAASDDITGIDGDWELEVGQAMGELKIPDYRFNLQCAPGATPTANVFAIQPSCSADGSTINTDGYLQISAVTGGLSYQIAIDGGAFGPRADIGATFPAIILSSQSNPAGSRDYIVRIYEEDMNGASDCFSDVTATMQQQDCTVGCSCTDYLYMAEPGLQGAGTGALYKFVLDGTFPMPQIGDPWVDATGTDLLNPHGFAADLNGNLYVGEVGSIVNADATNIRKITCDGEILPDNTDPNGFSIDDTGTNFQSIGNTLYVGGGGVAGIRAYDLCDGSFIGTACFNPDAADGTWELDYNRDTDLFLYGKHSWGIYAFSSQELDEAIATGDCITNPLIPRAPADVTSYTVGDNFIIWPRRIPGNETDGSCNIWGLTSDNDGNIYANASCVNTGQYTSIIKWDSNGEFVTQSPVGNLANGDSYASAIGLRYHAGTDRLYHSNYRGDADCISSWNTALTVVTTAVPPTGIVGLRAAKAINVITECCPTNNNQVVEIVQCNTFATEPIFLNEIFPCDGGSICEAEWEAANADAMAVFDACNQSIMIGTAFGCYTFTRSSDGTGANAQCGAFVQSFTVSISTIESGLIIPEEQTICRGDDPEPIVAAAATGTGGDISYQWYSSIESDTTGYSLITGATELTYTPTAASLVNDTTYFRIVSNITTCTSGMCSDTSEAVFVVVLLDPLMITAAASCDDENGMQVAENTYYIEVSAITGGDDAAPYDVTMTVNGVMQTQSFTGTSLFFGPFDHSGVENGGAVQQVTVQDNRIATSCETVAEVPEILCGINDGGQAPGCFCDGPTTDPTVPTSFILAQSEPGTFQSGGTSGQVQRYILVDASGNIVETNLTGLFGDVAAGTYTPYAINYRLDEEPTLLPYLDAGDPIQPILDGLNGLGDLAGLCYTTCNVDTPVMYTACTCYSVGSTVFTDLDNDGMFGSTVGETGIEGVTIELLNAGGMVIATTMTDANGDYYFGGLDAGNYSLNIPTPDVLYPISSTVTDIMDNGEDNDDNGIQTTPGGAVTSPTFELGGVDPEPSGASETGTGGAQDNGDADVFGDMTQDFGFFAPVSVGDVAFFDLNEDGLQTVGEPGVEGVTVTLLDGNGAVVTTDLAGNDLTNVMTGSSGGYLFENLPPGVYSVQFDYSTIANPEFYTFTTANTGGNDATDSDNSIVVNATTSQSDPTDFLNSGESDPTLDVGLICAVAVTVAEPSTICSTQPIDLSQGASITPVSLGGTWSTPDGSIANFNGGTDFATATTYTPDAADIRRGSVTLVLTTNDPAGLCGSESAMVTIQILKVDCGSFFWDGRGE